MNVCNLQLTPDSSSRLAIIPKVQWPVLKSNKIVETVFHFHIFSDFNCSTILFNMPQTINVDYMYLLLAIKEVSLLDTKSFVNNERQ